MHAIPVILMVSAHRGVWRVTRDGAFFGDYRSKGDAMEGAEAGAAALRRTGLDVKVALAPK